MIEKLQNVLITIIISVVFIGSYDYYKENKVSKNDEISVSKA